jgi:hypothetical protein
MGWGPRNEEGRVMPPIIWGKGLSLKKGWVLNGYQIARKK